MRERGGDRLADAAARPGPARDLAGHAARGRSGRAGCVRPARFSRSQTYTFRIVGALRVAGLVEPISHFSDAVVAGKTLYVSGLVATDERGEVVGQGDVVEQTRQIFRNLRRVLDAAGAAPSDVAKVTSFMRDVAQRPLSNPFRQAFC